MPGGRCRLSFRHVSNTGLLEIGGFFDYLGVLETPGLQCKTVERSLCRRALDRDPDDIDALVLEGTRHVTWFGKDGREYAQYA